MCRANQFVMGVYRFEDLRVWQAAKRQSDRVGELLKRSKFREDLKLCDQMNAASISVSNNISEGFVRRRDNEMRQFLRIAAASNAEVRSCYHVALGRGYWEAKDAKDAFEDNDAIGRMLRRFQQSLTPEPTRFRSTGGTRD